MMMKEENKTEAASTDIIDQHSSLTHGWQLVSYPAGGKLKDVITQLLLENETDKLFYLKKRKKRKAI